MAIDLHNPRTWAGGCSSCGRTTKELLTEGHQSGCPRDFLHRQKSEESFIKVYRIRKEAKLPVRAHPNDAGIDLFYCPPYEKKSVWNTQEGTDNFVIYSKDTGLVPTGIKIEIPSGYMMEIKNKSGIAYKKQLIVGACVVDSSYDGEIFVNLHNIGQRKQVIEPGDKVAQGVIIPIKTWQVKEVLEDNLNQNSSRGSGGFGSTGDK